MSCLVRGDIGVEAGTRDVGNVPGARVLLWSESIRAWSYVTLATACRTRVATRGRGATAFTGMDRLFRSCWKIRAALAIDARQELASCTHCALGACVWMPG